MIQSCQRLPLPSDLLCRQYIDTSSTCSAPVLRRSASSSNNPCLSIYNQMQLETESSRQKLLISSHVRKPGKRRVRDNYRLSTSSSTSSFFGDTNCVPLNRSKTALSETLHQKHPKKPLSPPPPRPRSLYVPFVGYVETSPLPPGKEARDILNALSYAPTENVTQYQTQLTVDRNSSSSSQCLCSHQKGSQSSLSSCGSKASSATATRYLSAVPVSPNTVGRAPNFHASTRLPSIPQYSLQDGLNHHMSSAASMTNIYRYHDSHLNVSKTVSGYRPKPSLSYSTANIIDSSTLTSSPIPPLSPLVVAKRSFSTDVNTTNLIDNGPTGYIKSSNPPPPAFSPTHPLHHSENTPIKVTHPPILYPPPDYLLPSSGNREKLLLTPTRHRYSNGGSSSSGSSYHKRNKSCSSNISMHSQMSGTSSSATGLSSFETAKSTSSFSSFMSASNNPSSLDQNSSSLKSTNPSNSNSSLTSNNSSSTSSASPKNLHRNPSQNSHTNCGTQLESIRETSPYCPVQTKPQPPPRTSSSTARCQ